MNPSLIVPPANKQHHSFERDLLTRTTVMYYSYLRASVSGPAGGLPLDDLREAIS